MKKRLILLASLLAMLLAATAALALAQEPGDEVRCLLPEGCGPMVIEDELLCFLPEGCDINGDGVPDLRAGEPVPDVGAEPDTVQYNSAL